MASGTVAGTMDARSEVEVPASRRRALLLAALAALAIGGARAEATPFAYTQSGAVIDTATDTVVATVPGGAAAGAGYAIAMNPAGTRVYASNAIAGALRVIDTAANTVIANVPAGSYGGVAVSPSGDRVYVAGGGAVRVIDASTNSIVTTIPIGGGDSGIAVSPDGSRAYVPTAFSMTVIDTASNTVVATVSSLPDQPAAVAVNPSGTRVYAGYFNNYGISGEGPTRIAVIDTATNTEVASIPAFGAALTINATGTRMYAADGGGSVFAIDLGTNGIIATIPFYRPRSIAINPAGTKVYFGQDFGSSTFVIDTATNTVVNAISTGANGDGIAIGPFCPGACSDSNPCTDDHCNPVSGACSYTNNSGPCTDGTFCNGADTCDGTGGCTIHAGDPCASGPECARTCDESGHNCFDPVTTACTSDGNVCTDDHCDGAGACIHPNNTAPCDDGVFCNGTDVCADGMCTHSGDPCAGGPECSHSCNEVPQTCFNPPGSACTADANPCTLDQCNGTGACTHPAGNPGAICRPAAGQCDVAETCTGTSTVCPPNGFKPDGTTCNDGNACTTADACSSGACVGGPPPVCPLCQTCVAPSGCAVGPKMGCAAVSAPQSALFALKIGSADATKHQVSFKWLKGGATTFAQLGDPSATDDYALCVFDTSGPSNLILEAIAPAGGTCAGKSCWKRLGSATAPKGWKYGDKDASPDGLTGLLASSGSAGKSKLLVKGKGANLPIGTSTNFLPNSITTQVQSTNGACWSAACSTLIKNFGGNFECKGE